MTAASHPPSARGSRLPVDLSAAVWLLPVLLWLVNAGTTWRFAVDVPYWDSWEFVELVTGREALTFERLWAQANEHRLPVQRLYEVAWAGLTGWDQRGAAFIPGVLLLAAALLFTHRALAERPSLTEAQRMLLIAILSFWFLSARQTDFLVWGIHFSWALLVLVLVLFDTLWPRFLAKGRAIWAFPVLVAAAVGSTGQGLALPAFLVLAGLPALVQQSLPPRAAWLSLLGLAAIAGYFIGYHSPENHPGLHAVLADPPATLKYLATYAGGPFTDYSRAWAVGLGGAVIALAAGTSLARRRRWNALVDLVARYPLLVIAGMLMVVIMIGRVGFGPEQAIASRYVPFAVLLAGSVLLLALDEMALARPALVTGSLAAVLIVSAGLWALGYRASQVDLRVRHGGLVRYRDCRLADPNGACDGSGVYPVPEILERRVNLLRTHHLSFVREESGAALR